MVLDGLFSFTANVNIDYGCIFYNQFIRLLTNLTPFIPLSLSRRGGNIDFEGASPLQTSLINDLSLSSLTAEEKLVKIALDV